MTEFKAGDQHPVGSDCESCGEEISHGWIVRTGKTDEEFNAPVVEMYCNECFHRLFTAVR